MPSLLFTIPTGTDSRTRNRCSKHAFNFRESRNTNTGIKINMNVHKGWAFPRGIYSEVHSPITTTGIICVMALTLQPIRGCPQHSGETGTRLSSAIHRCLLSRFFQREGDVCTQATKSVKIDGNRMDKVRRIVHPKLRPFHSQIKTYYLSDASYPTDNPSLVWIRPLRPSEPDLSFHLVLLSFTRKQRQSTQIRWTEARPEKKEMIWEPTM